MGAALSFAEARRAGMGGSDQAPRLGLSPFMTPAQLQAEKLGKLEVEETDPMWLGTVLEAPLAERFTRETGLKLRQMGKRHHKKWSHCFAHVDRKVEGLNELCEIKVTTKRDDWGEPGTDQVPVYYLSQVQHYLGVTGYERAHVWVMFLRSIGTRVISETKRYIVEADKDLAEDLLAGAHEWYERHVVQQKPVEPVTADDLALLHARSNGHTIEADAEMLELLAQLNVVKAQLDELKEQRERFEFEIKNRIGDCDGAVYGGKPIVTWKSSTRARIDVTRLKAEMPEVAARFLKESESRRFLPKWNRIEELI
jgi:putative phage-type endonuclease